MDVYVFKVYPKNVLFQLSSFVVIHPWDLLVIVKAVYF